MTQKRLKTSTFLVSSFCRIQERRETVPWQLLSGYKQIGKKYYFLSFCTVLLDSVQINCIA